MFAAPFSLSRWGGPENQGLDYRAYYSISFPGIVNILKYSATKFIFFATNKIAVFIVY